MTNEVSNLHEEGVLEVIKGFPYVPMRNRLVVTVNTTELDPDEPNWEEIAFNEWQYVIAVGNYNTEIKPGDKVLIDVEKITKTVRLDDNTDEVVHKIDLKAIEHNGRMYALIFDSFIELYEPRKDG